MVSALRRLGFDAVFDTDLAADLTIVEEANELVERIKKGGTLPIGVQPHPFGVPGLGDGAEHLLGGFAGGEVLHELGVLVLAVVGTAAEWLTGSDAAPVDFVEVRGVEGVKEATYQVGDLTLNVAVASGLARLLLRSKPVPLAIGGMQHLMRHMAARGLEELLVDQLEGGVVVPRW